MRIGNKLQQRLERSFRFDGDQYGAGTNLAFNSGGIGGGTPAVSVLDNVKGGALRVGPNAATSGHGTGVIQSALPVALGPEDDVELFFRIRYTHNDAAWCAGLAAVSNSVAPVLGVYVKKAANAGSIDLSVGNGTAAADVALAVANVFPNAWHDIRIFYRSLGGGAGVVTVSVDNNVSPHETAVLSGVGPGNGSFLGMAFAVSQSSANQRFLDVAAADYVYRWSL